MKTKLMILASLMVGCGQVKSGIEYDSLVNAELLVHVPSASMPAHLRSKMLITLPDTIVSNGTLGQATVSFGSVDCTYVVSPVSNSLLTLDSCTPGFVGGPDNLKTLVFNQDQVISSQSSGLIVTFNVVAQ